MYRYLSTVGLIFLRFCAASPVQQILGQDAQADPGFPLPPALPFNATLPGVDYELYARLKTAPSYVARAAMLPDEAFKFDFINPPNVSGAVLQGKGGTLVNALGSTMPALIGNGAAAGIGFTKPCG
jgi:hypothetical protein